jgi:hypothetical protein
MAFVKTTWIDDSAPDMTAAQLNRIEQGIADAHAGLTNTPPFCHCYISSGAAQPQIPNTGAYTTIPFDSEFEDTDNIHDPAVNPSRLTCRTAGIYAIEATLGMDGPTGGDRYAAIRYTPTAGLAYYIAQLSCAPGSSGVGTLNVKAIKRMAVGDYVELRGAVFQASGAANVAIGTTNTHFTMVRLGS